MAQLYTHTYLTIILSGLLRQKKKTTFCAIWKSQQWPGAFHPASCPHQQWGFPGCDVSECNQEVSCGLRRPWLRPLLQTGLENVTLITEVIPFTRHSSSHRDTGVHTQMKRGIVPELVSSTVSQGLPVVRSWGALVRSSCQKLWLREAHCVWPDNFALQKLNFAAAVDDCVYVCVRARIWDLVLCSRASSPSLTSLWSWNTQLPVVSVVFYLTTKFPIISLSFVTIIVQKVEVEDNELVWSYRSVVVLFSFFFNALGGIFWDGTEWQHDRHCLNSVICRYWSRCTEQNRFPNNCTHYRGQCKQQQQHTFSFHVSFPASFFELCSFILFSCSQQ